MMTDHREKFLCDAIKEKDREIENLKTDKYELLKQVREKEAWLVLAISAFALITVLLFVFANDNIKKRYQIESLNNAIQQSITNLKSESNEQQLESGTFGK